jgi:hypothetical protein
MFEFKDKSKVKVVKYERQNSGICIDCSPDAINVDKDMLILYNCFGSIVFSGDVCCVNTNSDYELRNISQEEFECMGGKL